MKVTSNKIVSDFENELISDIEEAINTYPGLKYNGLIEEMFGVIDLDNLNKLPISRLMEIRDFIQSF